ncbi:MAG: Asp23/Gls24 family envelope stress response protein [Actinomycetota bacterium]|nr:Asp23/Gls24 family envelope stress response protein [Actinomycetota bacterium]MDQ3575276.1 Asp23/Gls24 family envelope stress response protein [Actinomycetota bacterium]
MTSKAPDTPADTQHLPATTEGLLTPRGETLIAPAVVEKIASKAATEVDGVGGVVQTGLGRLLPWVSGDGPAQAAADVHRDTVAVDLTVNVVYPEPVTKVTGNVRDHVAQRLAALTGLTTTEVNITVDELVVERRRTRRRVE